MYVIHEVANNLAPVWNFSGCCGDAYITADKALVAEHENGARADNEG